jgi:hypothetical protein
MTDNPSEAGAEIEALCREILAESGVPALDPRAPRIAKAFLEQAERLKLAENICKWISYITWQGLPHDTQALKHALAAWRSARGET